MNNPKIFEFDMYPVPLKITYNDINLTPPAPVKTSDEPSPTGQIVCDNIVFKISFYLNLSRFPISFLILKKQETVARMVDGRMGGHMDGRQMVVDHMLSFIQI